MAEEKNKKKKAGIVKQILKWFGLAVLVLLLIASIIFEAPWKVITLLLIVLAACRILPKPAIKWFWLTVGVLVIVLIIWVFLPDETEGWRPYTFDEELAALEAKYAIPDEENAALIYNQLLENYNEYTCRTDVANDVLSKLPMREPWSSKDHPKLAEWLQKQQVKIAKLLEASKKQKCRFPIAADSVALSQHMQILTQIRHWNLLLITAASNDIGEGRIEQALENQIVVLQMASHLYQQPILVDLLVGMAIEALAIGQFKEFIIDGNATEEHLTLIDKALAEIKHDWSYDFPRILKGEKLLMKNLFSMFYEINPKGKVRLSRDPTAAIRAQFPQLSPEIPPLTYWRRKLAKAGTIIGWFFVPTNPQKAGEIIDARCEKLYAMAEPDFDWQKEPKELSIISIKFNFRYLIELLTGTSEEAFYYRIHDIYLRVHSGQRGSQLLIGLRRYKNKNGHWPESLDDIKSLAPAEIFVDPVNDDSFVYKLTEENFTLYSKGKNNIDENGEYQDGADDRLIWPPWTTKAKEENPDAEQQ